MTEQNHAASNGHGPIVGIAPLPPVSDSPEELAMRHAVTLRGSLILLAALLLAALATAMGIVSWHGQYTFIEAIKHQHIAAALEALGPDTGAVIFAVLGVALALLGRRAVTERILVCACAALSILMNLGSANLGSPRAIGAYIMPPVLFAITSDRLIAVIRRSALGTLKGDSERSPWQFAGLAFLYALRLILAPPSTVTGLRRALLDATPLPSGTPDGTPAAAAIPAGIPAALPAARAPRTQRTQRSTRRSPTKTQRFMSAVRERHGELRAIPLENVSRIASELAPTVDFNPGQARKVLRAEVLRASGTGATS
jgi:hypothetical protein